MDDLQKIETLQKRVTEHLADMKRLERENQKNKKRGDMLQKEKDHARSELSKSITLREKLEKLCRELQRENNRLKVRIVLGVRDSRMLSGVRVKTNLCKIMKRKPRKNGTRSGMKCYGSFKTIKTKKITLKLWSSIPRLTNCKLISPHVLLSTNDRRFLASKRDSSL